MSPIILKKENSDLKKHENLYPENLPPGQAPRVGQNGYDKNSSLDEMVKVASKIKTPQGHRANILVKPNGPNGRWYIKYCDIEKVNEEIEKHRNSRHYKRGNTTLYIILYGLVGSEWEMV